MVIFRWTSLGNLSICRDTFSVTENVVQLSETIGHLYPISRLVGSRDWGWYGTPTCWVQLISPGKLHPAKADGSQLCSRYFVGKPTTHQGGRPVNRKPSDGFKLKSNGFILLTKYLLQVSTSMEQIN